MLPRLLVRPPLVLVLLLAGFPVRGEPAPADDRDRLTVGVQPDGRVVVPTNQILKPAGTQVTFPGRPVDLTLVGDGRALVVKNRSGLVFLDVATAKIRQTLKSPVGFSAVGLLVRDDDVFVTDAGNEVRRARRQKDGRYAWTASTPLVKPKIGGVAYPTGLCRTGRAGLWVASSRGNSVQLVNLTTDEVKQVVPVGVAPYAVCCPKPGRCYVTNWGGDPPARDAPQATSSGTAVRVDPRTGVADRGTVTVLELVEGRWRRRTSLRVGLHPSGLIADRAGRFVYVANANSDTVSVIDTAAEKVVETIDCRPAARLPFGSGSNALALSPDGGTLYVANGTNNCVAVVRLGAKSSSGTDRPAQSAVLGLIPTGWYPGAVLLSADGRKLFVANVKGVGSLSQPRPAARGKNSHDALGSVSIINVPDARQLARDTAVVHANNRLAYSLAGLEKPRPDARPVPVPARHGEPSLVKHVIYVIKENRTYDQVFGDLKEGNGDPRLTIFGEQVTPNHHALARQFTLFDNFYCSGVLSADGHQWVNEAYVVDYLEKQFGRFARSYPYEGSDPLAFASTGFLWDNALARRRTFRNYGEFVRARARRKSTWANVYADVKNGTDKVAFDVTANVKTLAPYTRAGYPGFDMAVPDVYRARIFLRDLKAFEKKGDFPNLVYLYLPCDHTAGTSPGQPTPAAMVADNDLALGQVVEAVSKSRFWKDTCIFVVEDDPQDGFDHVDGHRTVALVISPYTRRKYVDHTCYNQTGMVKTIELILGLPPMNQLDLSATAMRRCFQARADLTPYACVPNRVPLDRMNPPLKALRGQALHWAKKSLALDFSEADRADEETLNRILWHAQRGGAPYPAR